ncbi:hypothetical protein HNQ72_003358 [Rhizobium wenxiniae]|uniref:Uncharacterized protein n=1 Tax=Rhizobium wenxiniae TaxID=1737357 RepID=A0A7W9Y9A1_9HYPH|nr:hypothetical protein [Rhizobium wenxiniae]MBB6163518.1 hypothetical protein [Rhizobium wenxiniae]
MLKHRLRRAAQNTLGKPRMTVGPHDDEISIKAFGMPLQDYGRIIIPLEVIDHHLNSMTRQKSRKVGAIRIFDLDDRNVNTTGLLKEMYR